jgi:Mn2+/Fe2+ NRAMP family transporter
MLWTAPYQIPLMSAVQLMSARIGIVTGRNLPQVLAKEYRAAILWVVVPLAVVANTVNAAADLAGIGASFALVTHIPRLVVVPIAAAALLMLIVFANYATIRAVLKWTTVVLFAYVAAAALAHPAWRRVLASTFIPDLRWDREYITMLIALFGTSISPYLFIWQSAEEVEEHGGPGLEGARRHERTGLRHRLAALGVVARDTIVGMTISQVITYSIILAAGATLYRGGGGRVPQTARDVAQSLRPIGGGLGTWIFAVGMIGTGFLAIPTLVGSSAYTLAAAFGAPASVSANVRRAKLFYAMLAASLVAAAALDFLGVSPVTLLFGAAVINGILAPPFMIVMMIVCNDRSIMKEHTNDWVLNSLATVTILLMGAGAIYSAVGFVMDHH